MNIYSSKAGPMTKDEMKEWFKGSRTRRLNHLCLAAAGWDPKSEVACSYNFDEGGLPERIRMDALNDEKFWIGTPDADGINKADKNAFAKWLSQHPGWKNELSCRRFIEAWVYYRWVSPHPESKIANKREAAFRAVRAVQDDHPELKTIDLAMERALTDPAYALFLPWLVYEGGPSAGTPLPMATLRANASEGKAEYLEKLAELENAKTAPIDK